MGPLLQRAAGLRMKRILAGLCLLCNQPAHNQMSLVSIPSNSNPMHPVMRFCSRLWRKFLCSRAGVLDVTICQCRCLTSMGIDISYSRGPNDIIWTLNVRI
eukprot:scaffold4278_cov18-Prasinocladus_malaysianus.AAC.1